MDNVSRFFDKDLYSSFSAKSYLIYELLTTSIITGNHTACKFLLDYAWSEIESNDKTIAVLIKLSVKHLQFSICSLLINKFEQEFYLYDLPIPSIDFINLYCNRCILWTHKSSHISVTNYIYKYSRIFTDPILHNYVDTFIVNYLGPHISSNISVSTIFNSSCDDFLIFIFTRLKDKISSRDLAYILESPNYVKRITTLLPDFIETYVTLAMFKCLCHDRILQTDYLAHLAKNNPNLWFVLTCPSMICLFFYETRMTSGLFDLLSETHKQSALCYIMKNIHITPYIYNNFKDILHHPHMVALAVKYKQIYVCYTLFLEDKIMMLDKIEPLANDIFYTLCVDGHIDRLPEIYNVYQNKIKMPTDYILSRLSPSVIKCLYEIFKNVDTTEDEEIIIKEVTSNSNIASSV